MISSSKKRYLFAIYELASDGKEVRCKDIAVSLKVKRPSVSKMLHFLAEDGLIDKEHYGTVHFTDLGICVGNQLYTNYLLLYALFHENLQVSRENARRDAIVCLCELSEECVGKVSVVKSKTSS